MANPPVPGPGVNPDPKKWTYYPAANDSRFLSKLLDSGEIFTMVGVKDASGNPLSLSEFLFVSADKKSSESVYTVDSAGVLISVSDGSVTTISGNTADSFVYGLSAGNKQLQIKISKDGLKAAQPTEYSEVAQPRTGAVASSVEVVECGCVAPKLYESDDFSVKAINAPIVEVIVNGCLGQKPTVQVLLSDEAGIASVLPAKKIGDNKYAAVLNGNYDGNLEAVKAGESILKFLDQLDVTAGAFGSIYNYLKGKTPDAIANAVASELVKAGRYDSTLAEFQQFLGLTDKELASAEVAAIKRAKFLRFIGKGIGTIAKGVGIWGDLKSFLLGGQALRDAWLASAAMNQSMKLQAKLITSKGASYFSSQSGPVSASGPYPILSVEADGVSEISSLVLNPSSPSRGVAYDAIGVIYCLRKGDSVLLRVEGTDGYSNSQQYDIQASGDQTVKLTVPGAEGGVRDSVNLVVTRSGVKIAERTASLIFG